MATVTNSPSSQGDLWNEIHRLVIGFVNAKDAERVAECEQIFVRAEQIKREIEINERMISDHNKVLASQEQMFNDLTDSLGNLDKDINTKKLVLISVQEKLTESQQDLQSALSGMDEQQTSEEELTLSINKLLERKEMLAGELNRLEESLSNKKLVEANLKNGLQEVADLNLKLVDTQNELKVENDRLVLVKQTLDESISSLLQKQGEVTAAKLLAEADRDQVLNDLKTKKEAAEVELQSVLDSSALEREKIASESDALAKDKVFNERLNTVLEEKSTQLAYAKEQVRTVIANLASSALATPSDKTDLKNMMYLIDKL